MTIFSTLHSGDAAPRLSFRAESERRAELGGHTLSTVPTTPPTDQLFSRITARLRAGRVEDVVRVIQQALERHSLPSGRSLKRCLHDRLGDAGLDQVIAAFATHDCVACAAGTFPCDVCRGRGHTDEGMIWTACKSLAFRPCEFCGGSGLLVYELVPAGIRLEVAAARCDRAMKRVTPSESGRMTSLGDDATTAGTYRGALLEECRSMLRAEGVFSNVTDALADGRAIASGAPDAQRLRAHLAGRSYKGLVIARQHRLQCLEGLCAVASAMSAEAIHPLERELEDERCDVLRQAADALRTRIEEDLCRLNRHARQRAEGRGSR